MKLFTLFEKCITLPYIDVEAQASFAVEQAGSLLCLYFEPSHGAVDWKNNLDFPARAYGTWFAHRGFVRVWCAAEKHLAPQILDPKVRQVRIAGYSHGAALAVLCHEYIRFHRPEVRVESWGFGCPRVVWGIPPRGRWEGFTVVRNRDDLVTHLPPAAMGYRHVGKMLEIGERGRYSAIDAHRPENYLRELKGW